MRFLNFPPIVVQKSGQKHFGRNSIQSDRNATPKEKFIFLFIF